MDKEVFKFRVKEINCGNSSVVLTINSSIIPFEPTYMGQEPLATLINACARLMADRNNTRHIRWEDEPGLLEMYLSLNKNILHLDIVKEKEERQRWEEDIPFDVFVSAIISEAFRVLHAFGIYGYTSAWMDHTEFPLATLLRICEIYDEDVMNGHELFTDISKELEYLQNKISQFSIDVETMMDECTVYYDAWQMQCCGKPFAVGEKVEWRGFYPSKKRNMKGNIIDFDEEHHGFPTHDIIGTVEKIIVERSEFPKGKREVRYDRANVIHKEIPHADGWESRIDGDETTERTLWGYIVELRDVTVSPLKEEKEENNM